MNGISDLPARSENCHGCLRTPVTDVPGLNTLRERCFRVRVSQIADGASPLPARQGAGDAGVEAEAGADHISIHPESGPHLHRSLQKIRSLGKKAGVVLNPATPVESVLWVLDLVDIIMVMTVNPGFGGQAFIASQLPNVAQLRTAIDATGRDIRLQIAGGVTPKTARPLIEAGADTLVAGSAVYGTPDYAAAISAIRSPA